MTAPLITPLPSPEASPSNAPNPLPAAIAWTRAVALGSVLGLIALGLCWELWLAPTGQRTLALKVLPLLLPIGGLMRNRMYTYRWLSLMVWLYFTEGVVRATSDRGAGVPLAMVEVGLCLLLFGACAAHVRWRLRNGRVDAQASAATSDGAPSDDPHPNPLPRAGEGAGTERTT